MLAGVDFYGNRRRRTKNAGMKINGDASENCREPPTATLGSSDTPNESKLGRFLRHSRKELINRSRTLRRVGPTSSKSVGLIALF